MKFIFTTEEKKNARKGIEGYRQSYIIDCREFVMQFNYDELTSVNSAQDFIVNKEIEKKLTKDQILNRYLNQIYLGQSAYGVEAAAQSYYRKSIKKTTLAESSFQTLKKKRKYP